MSGGGLSVFLIGFASGAIVFWQLSRVSERFRRARRDLRTARKGIRTLVEMVISRGWQALKLWLLVTAVLGAAVAAWLGSRSGR